MDENGLLRCKGLWAQCAHRTDTKYPLLILKNLMFTDRMIQTSFCCNKPKKMRNLCLAVRDICMQVVTNLIVEKCLLAFIRHVASRGKPMMILPDIHFKLDCNQNYKVKISLLLNVYHKRNSKGHKYKAIDLCWYLV